MIWCNSVLECHGFIFSYSVTSGILEIWPELLLTLFRNPLWFVAAPVNKLVPWYAWLLGGALDYDYDYDIDVCCTVIMEPQKLLIRLYLIFVGRRCVYAYYWSVRSWFSVCPPEFTSVNASCYGIIQDQLDYDIARNRCLLWYPRAYAVLISDAAELNDIQSFLNRTNASSKQNN